MSVENLEKLLNDRHANQLDGIQHILSAVEERFARVNSATNENVFKHQLLALNAIRNSLQNIERILNQAAIWIILLLLGSLLLNLIK